MKRMMINRCIVVLTWWIAMGGLIAFYDWTAAAICLVAGCSIALLVRTDREERTSCEGCRNHLGGGSCRINEEDECCEGGGFELWDSRCTEEDMQEEAKGGENETGN